VDFSTAIKTIEAEIRYARDGLEYYRTCVDTLEKVLAQLKKFEKQHAPSSRRGRGKAAMPRSPEEIMAEMIGARAGKRVARVAESHPLPYTGGDYWYNLVTREPRTAAQILHKSIDSLGFEPTREQVHKLRLRVVAALNSLVADKRIKDSGSGRERVYFKG